MLNTRFKLDTTFFEGLLQRLNAERCRMYDIWSKVSRPGFRSDLLGNRREQYPLACIPSLEHLAELVEVAFWASLLREEGRTLSSSHTIRYGQTPAQKRYWT
jgi:hypothetical protein